MHRFDQLRKVNYTCYVTTWDRIALESIAGLQTKYLKVVKLGEEYK
jgi:hypothetical protein